jgi:hypothetical protein
VFTPDGGAQPLVFLLLKEVEKTLSWKNKRKSIRKTYNDILSLMNIDAKKSSLLN